MEKKTFINRMADAANMPKDVVLGVPILTMTGQNEVSVENYRGIIEYTDLLIRIQTKIGQIKIIGKSLQIDYYTNDEMKITGRITSISLGTRVLLAYVLSAIPAVGIVGIWWAIPIGWFLADAVGFLYYHFMKK